VSDDPRPLLVYDGSKRLFRTAANRLTDGATLRPVRWGHESVQAFLDAQFGSRPFAFILVEDDHVHVGAETVTRLLRKGGVDGGVARLFERAYPTVAGPFGRVVHGQAPADITGSFPLDEQARGHLAPLRREQTIPVTEE
jgi:hypothetical protein